MGVQVLPVFLGGFGLSLGLILAIGPQNAFVLRQGLRREHVLTSVLFCAASDATLIVAGVAGIGLAGDRAPWLVPMLRWGGVAFLAFYGARSLWAAWKGGEALTSADRISAPLGRTLAVLAAITWLNPHVYLDTMVLIGSVATQYPGHEWVFAAGAASGSTAFFAALGFGARLLVPLFARPVAWRILDVAVAVVMWSLALSIARG